MDCKLIFEEINIYINKLENENSRYKRQLEEITRENARLKDNEKEMFKVSTIITTSNENAKLKSYVSILETQLNKYKEKNKVVYKDDSINVYHDDSINVYQDDSINVYHDDSINVEEIKTEAIPLIKKESVYNCVEEINNERDPIVVDEKVGLVDDAETYKMFKYKDVEYLMDEDHVLYEMKEDGDKGEIVGKRKYNKKTCKWKTVLLNN
jgi:hypothetical protein